jgi:hypothetical protein
MAAGVIPCSRKRGVSGEHHSGGTRTLAYPCDGLRTLGREDRSVKRSLVGLILGRLGEPPSVLTLG